MIDLPSATLSDAIDLHSQAKQAHWNVKGSHFIQLHELFDTLASDVLTFIHVLAERATALGGEALGTVRIAEAASCLEKFSQDAYDENGCRPHPCRPVGDLARAARAAADAAEVVHDSATTDLLVESAVGSTRTSGSSRRTSRRRESNPAREEDR